MKTAKIAVDSCYVLRQFLTPLPSIDFREIRGLTVTQGLACPVIKKTSVRVNTAIIHSRVLQAAPFTVQSTLDFQNTTRIELNAAT